MSLLLHRIDDRLIHGQVVVGWGQPLELEFIVLVDDDVASSEWEQELYRMGVPPGMDVYFHSVDDMASLLRGYQDNARAGILLVGSIDTMQRLVSAHDTLRTVNVGGVHHAEGRAQRLRYVFLTPAEEVTLRDLQTRGVEVTAQDLPSTRPMPLNELLTTRQDG